jgi:hypothetical protein
MKHLVPSPLLRSALAWDAAASGTLALLQIMQPYLAARLFGLTLPLVIGSGIALIAYAALLLWMTLSLTVAQSLVRLVIGGNVAWAAGSVSFVLLASTVTSLGLVYLLLQATVAVVFAAAQAIGLQRSISVSDTQVDLAAPNSM